MQLYLSVQPLLENNYSPGSPTGAITFRINQQCLCCSTLLGIYYIICLRHYTIPKWCNILCVHPTPTLRAHVKYQMYNYSNCKNIKRPWFIHTSYYFINLHWYVSIAKTRVLHLMVIWKYHYTFIRILECPMIHVCWVYDMSLLLFLLSVRILRRSFLIFFIYWRYTIWITAWVRRW